MAPRPVYALVMLLLACADGTTSTPTPPPPSIPTPDDTGVLPPSPSPPPEDALALPPPASVETEHFATADQCADCHSNHSSSDAMRDLAGSEVAPYDLWQGTMMANASRDPLWRAVVSAEIAATPGAAELIGQRCMNCHAPMAQTESSLTSLPPPGLATLQQPDDVGGLALDGVSCTLCHQIDPTGLNSEDNWKGNYTILPGRTIYGPHAAPVAAPMVAAGWTPVRSGHINDANLCGSCHMLITDALNPNGTPNGGQLVEQAPLLEMRNSSSANSRCQNCHLPNLDDQMGPIVTPIARNPDGSDDPSLPTRTLGRHVLVGGNTLIPQLFRDRPDILQPAAPPEAFQATIDAARNQLATRTAMLVLPTATRAGDTLTLQTRIDLMTGHKFPTGIPLRRAWLRVEVRDANDQVVFLSGDFDAQGRILVGGQVAPFELAGGPLEPHHDQITSPDQVQVYEALMADLAGQPTFLLLRGAGWIKDNRLLPAGWSPTHAEIDRIRPWGTDGDADYQSGGDTVTWTIDVAGAAPPFSIDARLYYQTLSQRFAEELYLAQTPETEGLRALLAGADQRPEFVAFNTVTVP